MGMGRLTSKKVLLEVMQRGALFEEIGCAGTRDGRGELLFQECLSLRQKCFQFWVVLLMPRKSTRTQLMRCTLGNPKLTLGKVLLF